MKINIRNHRFTGVFFRCLFLFLIVFLTGTVFLYKFGVYPFGDNSLMGMDLYDQYFPMYYQQSHLNSISGLFHSWNGSLGYNNWVQSAYYCNSIFLPLFRLIPNEYLVDLTDWLIITKIALSAVTCLIYLEYKTGRPSPLLLGGSAAYSLCGYVTAYMLQIMWTDLLLYTPLVLLGLERLLQKKKGTFYTLLLSLCIITNFYIAFSLCLFLVFYVLSGSIPLLFTKEERSARLRRFTSRLLRFICHSLLAAALSAFVLLPVGLALNQTAAASSGGPVSLSWYHPAIEYLKMMMPNQTNKLEFFGVNIFTGTTMLLLIPLYFCNRDIPAAERICNGCFVGFLFASMNLNVLDYIWHGFHFPNFLPGRWTFLFSLLLVELSCRGIVNYQGLTVLRTLRGLSLGCVLLFVGYLELYGDNASPRIHYILFAAAAAVILLLSLLQAAYCGSFRDSGIVRKLLVFLPFFLASIQIADSSINFVHVAAQNKTSVYFFPRSECVFRVLGPLSNAGQEWGSKEDSFYRVETPTFFTHDSTMLGNDKGISVFSSTMPYSAYKFLMYLGLNYYTENLSAVYVPDAPVLTDLLGIRYLLDYRDELPDNDPSLTIVSSDEEKTVWENTDVLPIAFSVSDSFSDLHSAQEAGALRHQNEFTNSIFGSPMNVYQEIKPDFFTGENVITGENDDWTENYFSQLDTTKPVVMKYTYIIPTDAPLYIEHNFRYGTLTLTWEGGSRDVPIEQCPYLSLGSLPVGTQITATYQCEGVTRSHCGIRLSYYDESVWSIIREYSRLSSLDVTHADDTEIEGIMSSGTGTLVCAMISQDGGWSVCVDGKETETLLLCDALLGFRLPAGTHTVTLRYHVPGLAAGTAISLCAVLILLILSLYTRKTKEHSGYEK